jgi:hypothetical protein
MGTVQHAMRAAKRYNQLKAERKARIAAEAEARSRMPVPAGLHDAQVGALFSMAARMSVHELLAAGLLWTRPELCRSLRAMVGIADNDADQQTDV